MPKQKRDNAYYLSVLKKDYPGLYHDVQAGKLSVRQARIEAGLGAARSRLHELKNSWAKASPLEQAEFLAWAGLIGVSSSGSPSTHPTSPAAPAGPAFTSSGHLNPWAKARILDVMVRRKMKPGDLAADLGLSRLDQSVMMAIKNGWKVKSTTATEVDR